MKLSSAQKQRLKGLAHSLHALVIIGNHGLTEAVQAEIECALEAHELIKIRVNAATKEDRQAITEAICQERDAALVQTIGHIVVIYRRKKN